MTARRRLDVELVRRGLVASRELAQEAIAGGRVLVAGAVATKAAHQVGAAEPVELLGPAPRFVGRGGEKLDAAIARFGIDCAGRRVLDAGASTGGFTDCVLQRGAAEVVALDVGRGQLHDRLRRDERVRVVDRTNIRLVTLDAIGGRPFDLVVADLSFISLRTVAGALVGFTRQDGDLVVLVKPQFEAGRVEVARGRGVVRDPEIWAGSMRDVASALVAAGAAMMGAMASPLTGAEGNVEFLLHARRSPGAGALDDAEIAAAISSAPNAD